MEAHPQDLEGDAGLTARPLRCRRPRLVLGGATTIVVWNWQTPAGASHVIRVEYN